MFTPKTNINNGSAVEIYKKSNEQAGWISTPLAHFKIFKFVLDILCPPQYNRCGHIKVR